MSKLGFIKSFWAKLPTPVKALVVTKAKELGLKAFGWLREKLSTEEEKNGTKNSND